MEIVGYCFIKKNATTGVSPIPIEKFAGNIVRVLEFASDGGVMVIDNEATGIGIFDACDVHSKFRCSVFGHMVIPPNLKYSDKLLYIAKCHSRKGGYDDMINKMVIDASLSKGEFNDSFLWQNQ